MTCPKCSNDMVTARATNFGDDYSYCRSCKKELAEITREQLSNTPTEALPLVGVLPLSASVRNVVYMVAPSWHWLVNECIKVASSYGLATQVNHGSFIIEVGGVTYQYVTAPQTLRGLDLATLEIDFMGDKMALDNLPYIADFRELKRQADAAKWYKNGIKP